jgi:hypothetical protein
VTSISTARLIPLLLAASLAAGAASAQVGDRDPRNTPHAPIPTLPPRDTSKLPATFAAAVATQPNSKAWPKAYVPKDKHDFTGVWEKVQDSPSWVPFVPRGRAQNAPLTPEYEAIFKKADDDGRAGRPSGDITANCLPQGMPRVMTMTYPMEITQNEHQFNIFAEWQEQTRRIYVDGRPLTDDPDPTYYGQSVGHWEGDVLYTTTFGLRGDTNLEASGLPHSDKLVVYERMWLSDSNTLNDEITLVDPKAFTKPWTVTKSYKRGQPGMAVLPYVCLENNRNPIAADGTIQTILQHK